MTTAAFKQRFINDLVATLPDDLATELNATLAADKKLDAVIDQYYSEFDKLRTLLQVARDMRSAQRRYFKERTQSTLLESKRLEKELDQLLAAYQTST